jgi:hypothetical protein
LHETITDTSMTRTDRKRQQAPWHYIPCLCRFTH